MKHFLQKEAFIPISFHGLLERCILSKHLNVSHMYPIHEIWALVGFPFLQIQPSVLSIFIFMRHMKFLSKSL